MQGFTTRAIHLKKAARDPHGSLRMPIYDSAAFEFESAQDFVEVAKGKKSKHLYTRLSNPTVEDYELHIKSLSGALGVIATGSGMSAITTAILTLVRAGDTVLTTSCLFGHTLSFFQNTLPNLGIKVKFVDMLDLDAAAQAFDPTVRMVFVETISNPQLEIADIAGLSALAHKNGAVLVADTTATPLYLFDAKKFGVDIEVLSSTKFISGGGTSLGGLIIDHGVFEWKSLEIMRKNVAKAGHFAFIHRARTEIFQNFGGILSPHNAYLQTLGLETMALRIDRACANTYELARWLEQQSVQGRVQAVNYPLLDSSRFGELARRQFGTGGAILTFELPDENEAIAFMDKLQIIRRATNIHDNKSLIVSPYFVIFPNNTHEERVALGIKPNMMRLAVGIEDIADLKEDIAQALEA
ncbi:O-acetylhomoserine sulfhydrylase [Campylobacterota bacterium]|nr:O-acetylhomoserine sulfhydrylase [Campylobacterota bacterium]